MPFRRSCPCSPLLRISDSEGSLAPARASAKHAAGSGRKARRCADRRWVQRLSPPNSCFRMRRICPGGYAIWTTSTSCSWTLWATCPRALRNLRNPRSSSPSSPNATNGGRWASRQTWSSRSGSASLSIPWPPPRRLTGRLFIGYLWTAGTSQSGDESRGCGRHLGHRPQRSPDPGGRRPQQHLRRHPE